MLIILTIVVVVIVALYLLVGLALSAIVFGCSPRKGEGKAILSLIFTWPF
jgi:hypothetical protein